MTFIKTTDINKNSFYRMEKELFNNRYYQKEIKKEKNIIVKGKTKVVEVIVIKEKLTDTSKILYSILCDLLPCSIKNGWYDKEQNIYIKFTVKKLAKLLNKSIDTIVSCKKELETNDLIKIVKKGYGKADIIFLYPVKKASLKKDNNNMENLKNTIDEDMEKLIAEKNNIITSIENKKESLDVSSERTVKKNWKTFEKIEEIVESKPLENFESIKTIFIKKRKTTKKEKNISSSYDFLKKEKYPLLKNITITNIKKFISNLTESQVDEIYSLTEKSFSAGKIKDFNAVLYMALKKEWIFLQKEAALPEPIEEDMVKGKFKRYQTMFKACNNFSFALECFVNSIAQYDREMQEKYIQKFEALEEKIQVPVIIPTENQYLNLAN